MRSSRPRRRDCFQHSGELTVRVPRICLELVQGSEVLNLGHLRHRLAAADRPDERSLDLVNVMQPAPDCGIGSSGRVLLDYPPVFRVGPGLMSA